MDLPSRASLAEVLDFSNKVRAAGGGNPISALMNGTLMARLTSSVTEDDAQIAYQWGRIEAAQGTPPRADRYSGNLSLRAEYLTGYADGLLSQIRGE